MTRIVKSKDCGNSPKNLLVQTLAISIGKADRANFLRCVTEDVSWTYPGRPAVVGRAPAAELLASVRRQAPLRIEVQHAMSRGRSGAANGVVELTPGSRMGFCHVIELASVKGDRVAKIISYYSGLE
ncbi:MAG TPA: nuclear transport factor 2 family protein [Planctomycetota bacterium]|nr:nuclear transport factor 2 family protein [Planctomycetota bacterium]